MGCTLEVKNEIMAHISSEDANSEVAILKIQDRWTLDTRSSGNYCLHDSHVALSRK